jgi:hypothetical protein
MNLFEMTLQRGASGRWPVVVEQTTPGTFLPVRTEGALELDLPEFKTRLACRVSPLGYGTLLGQALFRDDVRDAFVQALAKSGDRLHVLLFVEAEDLRGLRWERLCAPLDGRWQFLSLDQRVPFCLYLPSVTDRRFPPVGRLDLRALVLAASPAGLGRYNLAAFDPKAAVEGVRAALGGIPSAVLGAAEGAVGPPTIDALCERITAEAFTLLHVVCHGRFQSGEGETILYLAGADGQVEPVTGTRLLERLGKLRGARGLPQFAFLSSCESAAPEAGGPLASLAQRLVRELGMPAVVAMTEPVTVATAQALAGAFYRRLREHGEVDRALSEACAGLAERHDIHVPVLYSRLGGRPLFSDSHERPLTVAEIRQGLGRAHDLIDQRAPVWQQGQATQTTPVYPEQADRVRRTLHAEYAELTPEARRDREEALDGLSNLCNEAIERTFPELALGKEPPPYDGRCPFRGLYAFRAEDQEFFFGREGLVQRLQERLAEGHFLAVLGPSGSGKSSLVLAGLVPALQRREKDLQVAYMTPGGNPREALEAVLQAPDRASLLVVDQFEELFTLCTDHPQRSAFLDRLLNPREPLRVVLTMRADFWGECAPYRGLKELMQKRQELIPPMDAGELRRAMEMQAAKVGLRFEADLSNTILGDVQGEPGAMPLLQHALLELWKRRHGRWLRAEEYRRVGGVKMAITETAEAVYRDLPADKQGRMRDLFVRLTRLDDDSVQGEDRRDARRRVTMEELVPAGSDPAATRALVASLADARLVVTGTNKVSGQDEVEVAHEALIRYWPRLAHWLDADRSGLRLREGIRRGALEWDHSGRDDSFLVHRGKRLEDVEALVDRQTPPLNGLEQAYVAACVAVRERERTQTRAPGPQRGAEDYQTLDLRVFPPEGQDAYPVELNMLGGPTYPRGILRLDRDRLRAAEVDSRDYGRALGRALFADESVTQAYQELFAAARHGDKKVRLRLRLDPPELQGLFWELLHYPRAGGWEPMTVTPTIPFSRHVPARVWNRPAGTDERPLRVLAVIASPGNSDDYGLAHLPAEDRSKLHRLLDGLSGTSITYLESQTPARPTFSRLAQELSKGYHVVHILCHAAFHAQRHETTLGLEGDDGTVARVRTESLVERTRALASSPLLFFLAGAETAPLGHALVAEGSVPAAVAMNGPVTLASVMHFTEQFYARLMDHGTVDLAMNEARAAIQDGPDWGSPVLFSRSENQLFEALRRTGADANRDSAAKG